MEQNQTLIAVLTDAISRFEEASITIAEAKESEIFAGGQHFERRGAGSRPAL